MGKVRTVVAVEVSCGMVWRGADWCGEVMRVTVWQAEVRQSRCGELWLSVARNV